MQQVICFGEVLWDLLPSGKIAGGAPMNVAFQLNQLGVSTGMISRIGDDTLGAEILSFLKSKNVSAELVQQDTLHPTGVVKVELTEKRHPHYEVVADAAWDFITVDDKALEAVKHAEVFVFGSLAARSTTSKNALLALIDKTACRVFDVNLRKPFFSKQLLDELLAKADIVKMNDEELDVVAGWQGFEGSVKEKIAAVKKRYQIDLLIVTQGAAGATTLGETGFCHHGGYKVRVQDTIGSGDAFLAGYISQYIANNTPEKCLDFGCKMGAYVATKRGGTPEFDARKFANLSQTGY